MKKLLTLTTTLLLFFTVTASTYAVGLGISPSRVLNENLVKGTSFESEVIISRNEAAADLSFTVQSEGDIEGWATTEFGDTFTIPEGVQRFPVKVKINVPTDAANGEYDGAIRFVSSPAQVAGEEEGSAIAISVNALLDVSLTVSGDQLLEYTITGLSIPTIEEGWEMQLIVSINNTGNVQAAPTKIELAFFDMMKEVELSNTVMEDFSGIDKIAPFSQGDFILPLENNFEVGQYWLVVKVYQEGELLKEKEVAFEVVEKGSIEEKGELLELKTNTENPEVGEVVKVEGVFSNTGVANIIGKLIVEVEKDGKIIDVIESSKTGVSIGEEETFSIFFEPEQDGLYTLKGYVEFSGKNTAEKLLELDVGGEGGTLIDKTAGKPLFIIVLVAVLVAAGTFAYLKFGKKKKRKRK